MGLVDEEEEKVGTASGGGRCLIFIRALVTNATSHQQAWLHFGQG